MSNWLGFVLGIVFAPFVFVGYYQLVKANHKKEIQGFIQLLEAKETLTDEELQFIREAKDFLNNQEKNIKESINDSSKTD